MTRGGGVWIMEEVAGIVGIKVFFPRGTISHKPRLLAPGITIVTGWWFLPIERLVEDKRSRRIRRTLQLDANHRIDTDSTGK